MNRVNVFWSIAESLREPFKPAECVSVMLPLTALRRLGAVLAARKPQVLNVAKATASMPNVLRHSG